MTTHAQIALGGNSLFELQQTLYTSSNYTRRRLHQERLHWISDAIARYAAVTPLSRAVEYGPGSGIYIPVLARHCAQVVAADIQPAYLAGIARLAEELPGVRLEVDDVQDSRFENASFGLVLCSEVLEHVPEPERSLCTLYRLLPPDGIAIVSTPQRFSVMELCCKVALMPGVIQLVRRVYREPVLETGHISLRTARQFRSAIVDAGFEVLEHARFGLYVPLVAEFTGAWGGRAIQWLERRLGGGVAKGLLWTQAYVLRKPGA